MENTPSVADVGDAELGQRIASEVMPLPLICPSPVP